MGANLSNARFIGCDVANGNHFSDANLTNTDFSDADIGCAIFRNAKFGGTKFHNAYFGHAQFDGTFPSPCALAKAKGIRNVELPWYYKLALLACKLKA